MRRGRLQAALRTRVRRLGFSALPIVQCGVAAGLAWYVANTLIGHDRPFFAPIAAVICLGVSLTSRLRRAIELVVGVSVGIAVGDLIVAQIGTGAWQIALVVMLAMAVAVFADGAALLVGQAGSSAVLVATLLPPGQSGGVNRWIDALVGGAVGVLVAAVLPADPIGPVRRAARNLLAELAAVLHALADARRSEDASAVGTVLERARGSQPLVDALRAAVRGGQEVTRLSPFLRGRRGALSRYAVLAERGDYAMRNTRLLARRIYGALTDDDPIPAELADIVAELASAVEALNRQLGRDGELERGRGPVLAVVRHVNAFVAGHQPRPAELLLVAQVRSIGLDLLQATGLERNEAIAAMRARAAEAD